ncbi:MAG: 3-hydroxyacyl-CoA dehydrogenase NAD-binding domain-containing protein [Rhodomicrobium sp.]
MDLSVEDGIAIAKIVNPPVNALGADVRRGLMALVDKAKADPSIRGAVICSDGKMFSGGADITEFDRAPVRPILSDLIEAISALGKPVVAAIQGNALGGGLELPLGCSGRVATTNARLGLPEIKLGLIPGAGGTQRLPRLIGAVPAFDMMLKGDPIPANRALELGLIDEIAEGDLIKAAKNRALALSSQPAAPRQNRLEQSGERDAFEKVAESAAKANRGSPNAVALIEAVRAAFEMPIEGGLALERQLFLKLKDDERSKALRYAFFSERKAAKVPGVAADTSARTISRAAVIGAGTMGTGIAICFMNAGIPVTIIEADQAALSGGMGRVKAVFDDAVTRGKSSPEDRDRKAALFNGGLKLEDATGADIIVEAVFEEMSIKKEIFSKLDFIAKPGAILATNTSYLNVNEIASATKRPQDVLGMHFFSPANIMRLLEVVRAEKTAPDVLKTVLELAPKLGKVPVTVGVCYGFVGNRMLARRSQQGERLLLEGALPQQIDAAMVNFGFRMGPFAAGDLAGLDVGWRIRKATGASAPVGDALCEQGRFGQKTGKGYYLYPNGSRTGVPDPEVENLIKQLSEKKSIQRWTIEEAEIVERLIYPMVNEGARILSEGIAARTSDIDVIWINGYGWPAWRGGPMYYADQLGVSQVASRLERFALATGDESLHPAPVLQELAKGGRKFAEAYP